MLKMLSKPVGGINKLGISPEANPYKGVSESNAKEWLNGWQHAKRNGVGAQELQQAEGLKDIHDTQR